MRSILCSLLFLFIFSSSASAQSALGFVDFSYASACVVFANKTSEAFSNPDVQLNKNGFGIGGSGIFVLPKNFVVGGGGQAVFFGSNIDEVGFNIGSGSGHFGYNFSRKNDLIIATSIRLGGYGATVNLDVPDDDAYIFANNIFSAGEHAIETGSFIVGPQLDILKTFSSVPGLATGISVYYNLPLNDMIWRSGETDLLNIGQERYGIFGVSLKIGFGKISN